MFDPFAIMEKFTKNPYLHDALVTFGRMSGWVAMPVVIAVFLGNWLDKKYGTEPYILISIVGLSFFVSMFGIYKESKRYIKEMEKKEKEKKNDAPSI